MRKGPTPDAFPRFLCPMDTTPARADFVLKENVGQWDRVYSSKENDTLEFAYSTSYFYQIAVNLVIIDSVFALCRPACRKRSRAVCPCRS
jgi:hypothetical protein